MSAIAVTGVGTALGRRLVERLAAQPGIERVLGIDRSPPEGVTAPRFRFHSADLARADLLPLFTGVDVVVHLGGWSDPARDDASLRVRNVDSARRVVESAATAGVGRVVLASTVLAYGAHPDNDVPLTEDDPLRGVPGFAGAGHAVEVERWIARFAEEHPDLAVTVLRLGLLAGPDVDSVLSRSLETPRLPAVRGHRPPLQFLHPDDAVSAIAHVIDAGLEGAYNVCSDGWLSYDEVTAIVGRRELEVPEEVAFSGAAGVYALRLGDLPPGIVSLFVHPFVMSNAALAATGWRPRYSNRDALAALAVEHAPFVTIGRVRTRWTTAYLVAVAGGVVGAVTLWKLDRLRRELWVRCRARRTS